MFVVLIFLRRSQAGQTPRGRHVEALCQSRRCLLLACQGASHPPRDLVNVCVWHLKLEQHIMRLSAKSWPQP